MRAAGGLALAATLLWATQAFAASCSGPACKDIGLGQEDGCILIRNTGDKHVDVVFSVFNTITGKREGKLSLKPWQPKKAATGASCVAKAGDNTFAYEASYVSPPSPAAGARCQGDACADIELAEVNGCYRIRNTGDWYVQVTSLIRVPTRPPVTAVVVKPGEEANTTLVKDGCVKLPPEVFQSFRYVTRYTRPPDAPPPLAQTFRGKCTGNACKDVVLKLTGKCTLARNTGKGWIEFKAELPLPNGGKAVNTHQVGPGKEAMPNALNRCAEDPNALTYTASYMAPPARPQGTGFLPANEKVERVKGACKGNACEHVALVIRPGQPCVWIENSGGVSVRFRTELSGAGAVAELGPGTIGKASIPGRCITGDAAALKSLPYTANYLTPDKR